MTLLKIIESAFMVLLLTCMSFLAIVLAFTLYNDRPSACNIYEAADKGVYANYDPQNQGN